jgi:hypothetical protein
MAEIPYDAQALVRCIQQVIGPIEVLNDFWAPGDWRLRGTFRGQPLQLFVRTHKGRLDSLSFGLSLGGRPIALSIHDHHTTLIGMKPVAVGDPDFDSRYRLWGWPLEVLQAVLDPPTRQQLIARFGDADPRVRTDDGYLLFTEPLDAREGWRTVSRIPRPEELAAWLGNAHWWTERTVAAFDQAHAARAAAHGSAAAAEWLQHHVGLMHEREARLRKFRVVVFAFVGAFALVLLLLTLAIASLFRCH